MTCRILPRWRAFRRDEAGNTNTVAFAIWTPVLLLTLATAFEVGLYTARATLLERGMDLAVREIRLSTGDAPQHEEIKALICEEAAIIPDCRNALRLEMRARDLRDWSDLPREIDCTDRALPVTPVQAFTNGAENELMVLRACAKMAPIFPMTWFSDALSRDTAGDYAVVTLSAFVQEPR